MAYIWYVKYMTWKKGTSVIYILSSKPSLFLGKTSVGILTCSSSAAVSDFGIPRNTTNMKAVTNIWTL